MTRRDRNFVIRLAFFRWRALSALLCGPRPRRRPSRPPITRNSRRLRSIDEGPFQLGPLGQDDHWGGESDYAGQRKDAPAPLRTGSRCRWRARLKSTGDRQSQTHHSRMMNPGRGAIPPARRPISVSPLHVDDLLSRACTHAHGGVLPSLLQRSDVQRYADDRGDRAGVQQRVSLCLEGRHHHPRRADRYSRLKGVDYLEPGTRIIRRIWMPGKEGASQDRAWRRGLIRTGRWALSRFERSVQPQRARRALHTCAKWLKERDAAFSAATALRTPSIGHRGNYRADSALSLVAMGMPIFDNLDLEAVGREAAKRNRWDFLVTASPAAVPGATGSVLNPIATF